jgi:hypothetical protein
MTKCDGIHFNIILAFILENTQSLIGRGHRNLYEKATVFTRALMTVKQSHYMPGQVLSVPGR